MRYHYLNEKILMKRMGVKWRMKSRLIVLIVCVFSILFTGCESKQGTQITIEKGTPRDNVIERFGEADEEFSDPLSDVFSLDGEQFTVYYKSDSNGVLIVDKVEVKKNEVNS